MKIREKINKENLQKIFNKKNMVKSWHWLLSLPAAIFGKWSWNPPRWMPKANRKFWSSRAGHKVTQWIEKIKAQPKLAAKWAGGILVGLLVLGGGSYAIYDYYISLPKPDYVEVTVYPPNTTEPESKHIYPIRVNFSKSTAKMDQINKIVKEGIKLKPSMPGVWRWQDDRTLIFEPKGVEAFKTDWLVGTEYTLEFSKDLFPDHLIFEKYKFKFTTSVLNATFTKNEFYIDPIQTKMKKAVATLSFNQPIDTEDFKKRVTIEIAALDNAILGKGSRTLAPKIVFNDIKTEAYIETENLDLQKFDQRVTILIDKGTRSRRGGEPMAADNKAVIDIPGRFNAFKISDARIVFARNEKFEPEQVFVLNTRTQAKSEDLAKAIKVYLLPTDHNEPGSKTPTKNYHWSSPSEVDVNVLKTATLVKMQMLPTEEPYSATHSFKIDVPAKRHLYIYIAKGLKGIGDYELGEDYRDVLRIPDYTPELMFMSQGAILTMSGDKKLPLLARNIKDVKFEIGRVIPSQVNFLVARMFDTSEFSKPQLYGDIEDFIMERFHEEQKLPTKSSTETTYFSLDLKNYIKDGRGFFYIKVDPNSPVDYDSSYSDENYNEGSYEGEEGDGEEESYRHRRSYEPQRSYSDRRLIMLTDLGMIAKHTSSDTTIIYVQNLRSGLPVAGATVEVIGQNGIAILSQETDASGRANFPKLDGFVREKRPIAFLARQGGDVSYLPYRLSDRRLLTSRFDVGGVAEDSESDQLTGMLFSDRGIYRPGDSVNIGLIVRSKTAIADVKTLPLKIAVTDPKGTVIKKETFPTKLFSLQDFKFGTMESSPTGTYTIQLLLIKKNGNSSERELVIGSTTVQVEEFVADKLKIHTTLTPFKSKGWVPLEKITANINLKNMFGTAAENRRIKAEASVTPISPSMTQFKDYTFINPNKKDAQSAVETLDDTATNEKGEASYNIDMSKYAGYFLLRLRVQGFEAEGGRSVETATSVVASHLPFLVGYKADGSLHYIKKNMDRGVNLIAVDTNQNTSDANVQVVLNEIKYVSTLVKQKDNTYKYQSISKEIELKKDELKITKNGTYLKLPTGNPGDFVYLVKNKNGDEINRVAYRVIGESNLTRSLDRNSELEIVLNKEDYQPGEDIELQIQAPYAGAGVITIERDGVYTQKWFKSSTNTMVEHIKVPENLTGNAYVNVTFLRDINSSEIYMSPLSYGIQPFSISLDRQRTKIQLKAPEKVKPGETLSIQYSASKPTELILYGVDEGILQVARYKTPDPLKHFFRKKALQVDTFQLLDLLLPEYSLLKQQSSAGGDADAAMEAGNLNPFRAKSLAPVVFWSGVLNAGPQAKTFTYTVPEYFNGNIKLMAVASSTTGLGATDSGSLSRGDFIITPTAPIFVTPSDEIQVGLNVSNQIENPKGSTDVKVAFTTTDHLSILGDKEKTLKIPIGHEMGTSFILKANNKLGVADIKITATNGTESARFTHQVSLRPATPFQTTLLAGITDEIPLNLKLDRKLYPEKSGVSLSLSPMPLGLIPAILDYLQEFPHGCTEQIVSQTIPHLVLNNRQDMSKWLKVAKDSHNNLLAILRTRQTSDGGFRLYESGQSHIPATLYAIHYLLEAQDRGYSTPDDMKEQLISFLKSSSLRKGEQLYDARIFAQAIYFQARYGVVPTNDLNYLLELLEKFHKDKWQSDDIASWIAGTYALLKQEEKGWALLKKRSLGETKDVDYFYYYSPSVRDSHLVQIIARHYPEKFVSFLDNKNLKALVKPLMQQQYNTVESGQLILAFSSLNARAEKLNFPGSLTAKESIGEAVKTIALSNGLIAKGEASYNADKVVIAGAEIKPLFYSLTQKGFDRELPKQEVKKGLEVARVFEDANGNTISKVSSGDEVHVSVRTRSVEKGHIPYIVIVDMFPAGFELIRDSVSGYADYIDKREDRLVIYANADQQMHEIKYTLKATHKGKFSVPPTFAESMYDKTIQYRGVANTIEVH